MSSDHNRKYKRPKQKTFATTNPETSTSKLRRQDSETRRPEPICPLLAKDSEWVDILESNSADTVKSTANISDEEVLQLVECEDGPQIKPLAIMFPGLLKEDPQMLQGILDKAISTTEVTKHLVNLGQKANFTFMKKADRLIPPGKQRLQSVAETSNSCSFVNLRLYSDCNSSNNDSLIDINDDKKRVQPFKEKFFSDVI